MFWRIMAPSFTSAALLAVVPAIFSQMTKLEYGYSNRVKIYLTLARTVSLMAVTMGFIVGKILRQKEDRRDEGLTDDCWENMIGQEMYRLLVAFTIINILIVFLLESVRHFAYKW